MAFTRKISQEERDFLEQYKEEEKKYPRPSVTADIAIFSVFPEGMESGGGERKKKLKLLLIKRGGHPCKDMFALPGGFVSPDETMDQAAERELKEETGISCGFLEQLRTFSEPGRDPRSWVVTGAYVALLDGAQYKVQAGDDAKEAAWFDVSMKKENERQWSLTLENGETKIHALLEGAAQAGWEVCPRLQIAEGGMLAFDHSLIIAHAVLQLRQWVKTTRLAFRLLPEKFTLDELQGVYEAALEAELPQAGFQKMVEGFVERAGEGKEGARQADFCLFQERRDG